MRAVRVSIAIILGLGLWLGFAAPAGAHEEDQSYVYLDVTEEELAGRVEVAIRDLGPTFDIDFGDTEESVLAAAEANQGDIEAYLLEHFVIGVDGAAWEVQFEDASLFFGEGFEPADNFLVYPFTVEVQGSVPRTFDVTYDPFFDELDDRNALLLIANDWEGGVIDNGNDALLAYTSGNRVQTVDLGDTGWWKNFRASIDLGVDHIKTGPDHILFILALLLPSVLIFTTMWQPAASFGAALWRVLKVMTMFTVAHSITFTLAGLDILPTPSAKVVESIIALSIAAAAIHNLRPIVQNKEWLLSFVFGLFHGMGFASLVGELDVDRSIQLVSLLGRNVGIEIGQVIIIVLVFPGLFLLRRTPIYQAFFNLSSIALAIVSLGWGIERVFEVDLRISKVIDPITEWPRSFAWIVIFTAVSAAIYLKSKNDGTLRSIDGSSSDDPPPSDPPERELVSA